jgi:hypothetical protein
MVVRKKKVLKRILDGLDGKPINDNPGRFLREKYPRPTKKDRRHSGRETFFWDDDDYPTQLTFYDDWKNYRDGLRWRSRNDKTKLFNLPCCNDSEHLEEFKELNKKIKKQLSIRRARKKKYPIA